MARICARCGRGAQRGATRSHSNIATIKHRQLNLQQTVLDGRRQRVCTSCLRTMRKQS